MTINLIKEKNKSLIFGIVVKIKELEIRIGLLKMPLKEKTLNVFEKIFCCIKNCERLKNNKRYDFFHIRIFIFAFGYAKELK